ncbi:alpha/beta fold hydrolase [Aliidiomarina maris]|uniref:Alpha/beta hydrolase n=1 Tax=Aliidiomarina maris TaxID=531312 RepID=A0A327X6Z6_9GAMM|nr:alpha/beta hydrolase [Aliidiomarina maris]RAK01834.1 pimeloyl-ACP methyl ester carboxylesterase [Aliidiomarina maris]RUO28643.1 alpha/beta hydrolase [Aliidiomarina maris]
MHIFCFHSSQSSGAQWRLLTAQLSELAQAADAPVTIHAPDLIGYGAQTFAANGAAIADFRLADEIEALLPLLEGVQIDPSAVQTEQSQPIHLIGHSYGGALALRMARLMAQAGTPPASVCLYEPVAFHVLPEGDPAREEILAIASKMDDLPVAQAAAEFVNYWNHPGYFEALPARVQKAMVAKQPKVQADFAALIGEPAQLTDYTVVDCPVLILHGTQSPLSSRTVAEHLVHTLPKATSAAVKGGHMAPLTDPTAVNPHIIEFLRHYSDL